MSFLLLYFHCLIDRLLNESHVIERMPFASYSHVHNFDAKNVLEVGGGPRPSNDSSHIMKVEAVSIDLRVSCCKVSLHQVCNQVRSAA